MQYGAIRGGTLPLTSPCEGKDYKHSGDKLQSSIGMKSSTLPLTSPCSGTKRKTTVPLFFASTGGLRLLSFIPILLLSLHLIGFYSPSLRRSSQTPEGSDCPYYRPTLHHSLHLIDFYSPSLRRFPQVSESDSPAFRPILPKILPYFTFYSTLSSVPTGRVYLSL